MNQFLSRFSELDNADQRAFLYSDLSSQKTDNPEGYQEAFKFWSRLLLQACEQGLLSATNSAKQQPNRSDDSDKGSATNDTYSALCIDRRGLAARLAFHGDTPMGVDEVVDDMVRQGDLVPMSEFLVGSGAWRWAGRLALRMPVIGRRAAALAWGSPPNDSLTLLASKPLIQSLGTRILDLHYTQVAYELTDNLMSIQKFRQTFASCSATSQMSAVDARLVIRCLIDMHKVTTTLLNEDVDNLLIKFASSRAHKVHAITEADINAHHVLVTREQISKQVEQLEQRISVLDQRARSLIRSNLRKPALNCLRLKKHVEQDVLVKRQHALENIERIVLQLQQSSSDLQLLQAFRSGACALKGLNQQVDMLDPQSIFDEWADQALQAKEIQDAMQDSTVQIDSDDEDVLEAELDALLAADSLVQQESEDKSPIAAAANDEAASQDADALADALTKVAISPPSDSEDQEEERVPIAAT